MEPLTASILTFNSERTLPFCLESVAWADEIVVLDSFSSDATLEIAANHGCRIQQQEFLGYGRQRQRGWEMARHRWVLVLDSDEVVSDALAEEIRDLLRVGMAADGYTVPRLEQLYWRMATPRMHLTRFLRLFDRTRARMGDKPVHAAPIVEGRIAKLRHPLLHYSKSDIYGRVETANDYSTDLVLDRRERRGDEAPWVMLVYPPLYFARSYFVQRHCLNGWAGFIAAVMSALYVFLKCAKAYEHRKVQRLGNRLLPHPVPLPDRQKNRRPA